MSGERVRVAAVQMNSGDSLQRNLGLAGRLLGEAADAGCALAVLPENFPFMGDVKRHWQSYVRAMVVDNFRKRYRDFLPTRIRDQLYRHDRSL